MNKQFLVDQAQTPPAFITGQLHLELSDKILEFPSRSGSDIRMPFTPAHVTLFGSEQNKHNIRVNREDNWEYVYSYPGYFLDNKLFAEQVQWLIEHEQLDKKLIADYLPEDLDVDDFLAKPKMTHFRELGKLLTQEGPLEFRSGEISEKSMTGEELRDHLNRFVQDGAVWRLMPREEWEEGVEKMINSAKYYQIFQERQGKVPSLPSLRYQEYLEEKVTQKERTLIADDFIEMLQPSNEGVSDVAVRQLFDHINDLDEKEFVFQKITKQYLLQLEEYFNEFGGQDGETKQAFIERFTQHNNGTWVRNKIDGTVLRVVPQEMLIKLLQRRANLAGMDHEQLEKIADSSVAFFGTSTGSHPFMQLVRMGIKQAHVTDVKEWKTSNLNRTAQGTLADLGVHKPVNLVSDALMINPYLNITVHPNVVKDGEVDIPTAEAIIRDSNLVIEMTDNFKIKSKIPTLAVKNGVPALCPDNVGIEPSVRVYIDESDLPDFPEVLNMEGFINIIGKDYISLQMMINTILTSERKMGFIAQQGPTAALTGAMTSINASRLLAGEEISRHIHVNYTNEMLSPEVQLEEYEQLEQHMRHQYPDIFALEDEQGYLSPLAKLVDDYVYKATGIETNYYSQIEQLRQTSL